MTSKARPFLGVWLAAMAFAGLLAGHFLGYAAAAPDPHLREELLAATGHGSHGLVVSAGVAAGLAAVIALVVTGVRSRERAPGGGGSLLRTGALLWALQSAGFTALELFERGGFAHGFDHLAQEPAFILGLVAQVVVALLAAGLVWLLVATVGALLRYLARPLGRRPSLVSRILVRVVTPLGVARLAWNLRGPPAISAF